ncbi:MAG: hypothetical protein KF814_08840 [Nitrospiraceae bacterium]|nr:hypothetical protein [Nitrospiraceae bacterium]
MRPWGSGGWCRRGDLSGWVFALIGLSGCGVLGPPVPPEDVGVNPVIERQLRREGLLAPGEAVRGTATRPSAPGQVTIEEFIDNSMVPTGEPLPVPPTRSMGSR